MTGFVFVDSVQAPPLLPAPVQAPPVVPAPVQTPRPLPAPVQTSPALPTSFQVSPSLTASVQAHPPLPASVQAAPALPVLVQAPLSLPAPAQESSVLPAPVQAPALFQVKSKKDDEEDKLSDVETEGYCDDKNPPDIITKIRTVKGQGMKDLYDNTDQVIISVSALVSLLEVLFPLFY